MAKRLIMAQLKIDDVTKYVEDNIGDFHCRRIASLDHLKLNTVLNFCLDDGSIHWIKLVQLNSGIKL